MSYTCGSASGTTDSSGRFNYESGSTCTFRIGGVTVGSATAAATLTPVSLVSGASDETNSTVANIARFLQSVDTDNNPSNGITVAASVRTALASSSLNFASGSFATDAQTVVTQAISGRTLVSEASAKAHLNSSLLGKIAGTYNCSYSGTDRGTATATLSGTGTISGTATSTLYNYSCALSGTFSSSGVAAFNAGGSCGGASFSGNLNLNGSGSGNWSGTGASGTWSCTK
ncbi:MAG: hypothetical protein ACT4NV_08715 [Rhodoferax sp.]